MELAWSRDNCLKIKANFSASIVGDLFVVIIVSNCYSCNILALIFNLNVNFFNLDIGKCHFSYFNGVLQVSRVLQVWLFYVVLCTKTYILHIKGSSPSSLNLQNLPNSPNLRKYFLFKIYSWNLLLQNSCPNNSVVSKELQSWDQLMMY